MQRRRATEKLSIPSQFSQSGMTPLSFCLGNNCFEATGLKTMKYIFNIDKKCQVDHQRGCIKLMHSVGWPGICSEIFTDADEFSIVTPYLMLNLVHEVSEPARRMGTKPAWHLFNNTLNSCCEWYDVFRLELQSCQIRLLSLKECYYCVKGKMANVLLFLWL